MRKDDREEIQLTEEAVEAFLAGMQDRGRKELSLRNYRQVLAGLGEYLPPGKRIGSTTAEEWKVWMEGQGYSRRTVNVRLSVLNSFLKYSGRREWQKTDFFEEPDTVRPELTRTEYMRLLKAAKQSGKEREYLLIKVMGSAGVRIQELEQVTVEAVREGAIRLEGYRGKRLRRLPAALQKELLAYAQREGIRKGPVFVARDGGPMVRSSIWYCVNSMSRDARVAEEKVNPRSLWRMYCDTWKGIEASVRALMDQTYERMLDEEQLTVGWEE